MIINHNGEPSDDDDNDDDDVYRHAQAEKHERLQCQWCASVRGSKSKENK